MNWRGIVGSLDPDEIEEMQKLQAERASEAEFQTKLFGLEGGKAPVLLGSVPSEVLGLGDESNYESKYERCSCGNRSKRKNEDCKVCGN